MAQKINGLFFSYVICGNKMQIIRKRNKKEGHIKTIWCYKCKEIRDHIESSYL